MKNALGLIETIGLAAAIEAADAAVKSANVKLIGYELTKGDGMVTVKIEGDVGAVKAGIEAAKMAASRVSGVYSTQVIPRPAQGLDALIFTKDTVGLEAEVKEEPTVKEESAPAEVKEEISEAKGAEPEVSEPEPAKENKEPEKQAKPRASKKNAPKAKESEQQEDK